MSKKGLLSAQIYQASSWAPTATGTASAAATVSASSTRYLSDLATAFGTALSTATGDTVTVTPSTGEGGTLRTVIASTANLAINWGAATDLRDIFGFTGNLSAATSHTSTNACRGVWQADCPMASTYGPNDPGHTEADRSEERSPRGDIWALQFQTYVTLPRVWWSHVTRARSRIAGETVTGESFERWWRYTHGGELSYFAISPAVRLIWDADTPGTYHTYRLCERKSTAMPRVVDEWAGLFTVELVNSVRVPGT